MKQKSSDAASYSKKTKVKSEQEEQEISIFQARNELLDFIVEVIQEKADFHQTHIMWEMDSDGEEALLLAHESEHEDLHRFFKLWKPIWERICEHLEE